MDIHVRVAENLKTIRESKRLSLESVSKLSGVSKSMLGQIERGEVNPTITLLWKIANGLKISFSQLIENRADSAEIIPCSTISPLMEDDGKFINYPIFPFDEDTHFETYRIVIKPSGRLDADAHMAGTKEYITVFSGTIIIETNSQLQRLNAGDSIRFMADTPHSYQNDGSETATASMTLFYAI